jgi:Glycosyl transferase family 2
MVTRGGVYPAAFAIECFERQSYANRELVVVCDVPESPLKHWLEQRSHPAIRYVEVKPAPLGTLRNASVAAARGDLLAQWDDDDLYHPDRLMMQREALGDGEAVANFLHRWLLWWPARRLLAVSGRRVWEGSMLVRRESLPAYPAKSLGEDTEVVEALLANHTVTLTDQPLAYCYVFHGANSFDTNHMDMLFAAASPPIEDQAYDAELARLESALPMAAYARRIARR